LGRRAGSTVRKLSKTVGAGGAQGLRAEGLIPATPYADGAPEAGMQQGFLIQGRHGSDGAATVRV